MRAARIIFLADELEYMCIRRKSLVYILKEKKNTSNLSALRRITLRTYSENRYRIRNKFFLQIFVRVLLACAIELSWLTMRLCKIFQ